MSQEIKLIRSKRKTLVIEVNAKGEVLVRAPLRMPISQINKFIGQKADWIDDHVRKMKVRQKERQEAGEEKMPISEQEIKLLKTRAKRIIPGKVRSYAALIGVTYGNITIRMQKSRWGSCSAKGNLNFNCLLMKTPDEIIDYVIVHELCHRKEMNHSPRFWAEVEKIIPDYKEKRKWLKDHGNELMYRPI
nr:SprT family zinc-dependent metalloprotease [uncultured Butyrivibrio sp.]